jgi:hypothetical protein
VTEADGYLIVFLNHFDTMLSSLAILDTKDLSAGPIARIKLPFRLRSGVHGSWVMVFIKLLILRSRPHRCQNGRKPLCDMTGIDEEVKELVKELNQKRQNGTANGVDGITGEVKTEDQNVPEGLPGVANGANGTTVWGVGALHHVIAHSFRALIFRDFDSRYIHISIQVTIASNRNKLQS